jgi:multidrug transporter EmrE-like cation transporter
LTPVNLFILLFAVTTAATGQVLLKHGMTLAVAGAKRSGASLAVQAAASPWVVLGLTVFAVSALAWLVTLSRLPLNIAYPFNALGYLGILTAGVLFLGERANVWTWVGTSSVVAGLVIIVSNRPT